MLSTFGLPLATQQVADSLAQASGRMLASLDGATYALVVLGLAVLAHAIVGLLGRGLRRLAGIGPGLDARRRRPKLASVTSLVTSAATFVIYFVAVGLVLSEFEIDLTAYIATASVIALAVGFGSQGLVQDVVIGLTLVFSDACDVGDVVEISGQIGRVDRIGLRFTTLTNYLGQTVFIPNRNIAVVGRFRHGVIRAYADVQIPEPRIGEATAREAAEGIADTEVLETVRRHAFALRSQHGAIVLADPEISDIHTAETGGWRYIRVKFRIWPGQGALIEQTFRPRLAAALRAMEPSYADWMIPVTYRGI